MNPEMPLDEGLSEAFLIT